MSVTSGEGNGMTMAPVPPSIVLPNRFLGTLIDEKTKPSLLLPVVIPEKDQLADPNGAGVSNMFDGASPERLENEPIESATLSNATEKLVVANEPVVKTWKA